MKTLLVLVVLALSVLIVQAANLKRQYCGNEEFLGNDPPTRYPHLHCGRRYITLSLQSNNHINFFDKKGIVRCNVILNMVINNPGSYEHAEYPQVIQNVATDFYGDFCSEAVLQRLLQLLLQNKV